MSSAMGAIDEALEALGVAETRGRREQADRLVAPGGVERMFGNRQQFEMGEAAIPRIGDEAVGQFVIGEETIVLAPRARSRDGLRRSTSGCGAGRAVARQLEIIGVGPVEVAVAGDDGGRRGPQLRLKAEGVGLQRQDLAVGAEDFEFVEFALGDFGNEDFPQAGVDALAQGMAAAVPLVEGADHRDAPGVGRPDRKMHAFGALMGDLMRAEPGIKLECAPSTSR